MGEERLKGYVAVWFQKPGYGFAVTNDNPDKQYFLHQKQVKGGTPLNVDMRVSWLVNPARNEFENDKAVNVEIL